VQELRLHAILVTGFRLIWNVGTVSLSLPKNASESITVIQT